MHKLKSMDDRYKDLLKGTLNKPLQIEMEAESSSCNSSDERDNEIHKRAFKTNFLVHISDLIEGHERNKKI